MMRMLIPMGACLCCLAAEAAHGQPLATPEPASQSEVSAAAAGQAIARVPLMERGLGQARQVETVRAMRIDFRPGQHSGKHMHPVPTMGIVLQGRIRLRIEGQPIQILSAGESFFEPADAIVLGFDNASEREPASFAAFYLLGPTDTMLVRELP
ncbi:cupin domain-containing protein [Allosphingosinicella deserti]|nr:cupin domain-containing protein [Sphingomonas deserti]